MRAISAHEHLAPDPQDIPFLIECGEYEQIWIQCGRPEKDYEDVHFKAKEEYGDFLEIFGNFDWTQGPDNIERLKDRGAFGLKAINPPLPYDHDSYFPLYEKAAELHMPVLFHTGVIGRSVVREKRGVPIPPRDESKLAPSRKGKPHPHASRMRPSMLMPIAATFPHLTLINAHPGFPWLEEAWENLYYYDNIYLDISSGHSFPCLDKWAFWFFAEKCKNPKLNFTDKMLFAVDGVIGVDRSAHEWIVRCTRFWKEFFELVGSGYRWGEDKDKLFIENARLILKECKGS